MHHSQKVGADPSPFAINPKQAIRKLPNTKLLAYAITGDDGDGGTRGRAAFLS